MAHTALIGLYKLIKVLNKETHRKSVVKRGNRKEDRKWTELADI